MMINPSKKTLEYDAQGIWVTDWTGVPQFVRVENVAAEGSVKNKLKQVIKKFMEGDNESHS